MGQAKENKYSEKADFKHNIARTSAKRLSSNNTSVMAIFYVFKLAYLLAFFFVVGSCQPSTSEANSKMKKILYEVEKIINKLPQEIK